MTNDFFFLSATVSHNNAQACSLKSYPLKSFRVWKSTPHPDLKHCAVRDQLSPHSLSLHLTYPPHVEPHCRLPSSRSLHNSPRSWKPGPCRVSATQSLKPLGMVNRRAAP